MKASTRSTDPDILKAALAEGGYPDAEITLRGKNTWVSGATGEANWRAFEIADAKPMCRTCYFGATTVREDCLATRRFSPDCGLASLRKRA